MNKFKAIQRALNLLNKCELKIDGAIGQKSIEQIKIFQAFNELTADGICGKRTIAKMIEILEASASNINNILTDIVDTRKAFVDVEFNSQRDNPDVGRIKSYMECGYASIMMMLSQYIESYKGDGRVVEFNNLIDKDYSLYKTPYRVGASLERYPEFVDPILQKEGIKRKSVIHRHGADLNTIYEAIKGGSSVVLSTMLTSSGHYINVYGIDFEKQIVYANDPWFGIKEYDMSYLFERASESTYLIYGKRGLGLRCMYTVEI